MGGPALEPDAPRPVQLSGKSGRKPAGPGADVGAKVVAALLIVALAGSARSQQPTPGLSPILSAPARQARDAGLTACVSMVDKMAKETVLGPSDLQSGWNRQNPEGHMFQSVVAVSRTGAQPPDMLVALIAGRAAAGGCDGASVLIIPFPSDCLTVERGIVAGGRHVSNMRGVSITLDANGKRIMLLPGANSTCIAVAVETQFETP